MTLLYIQGFEGFPSTSDRTDFDVEFDFEDSVSTGEAAIHTGRTGGQAGWIDNGNNDETSFRLPVSHLSSEDDWIVGVAFRTTYNYFRASTIDPPLIEFRDANHTRMLAVIPEAGTLRVANGSGTVIGIADVGITTNVWHYVELKVNLNSSTGSVTLRLNEEQVFTDSSVNTVGGSSFTRPAMIWLGNAGDDVNTEIDDIYICDDQGSQHNDFLGDNAVRRLSPNGVGNSSQFTVLTGPANWQDVDESDPDDDSTYVESRASGDKDTYAFGDISDDPAAIEGVAVKSYVKKSDAGSRTFVHVARSSGTESDSSVIYPSAVTYRHLASIYPQDPNTSAAWTKAGINAAEFGFKVNS